MCIYCGTQYHRLIYENHNGPIPVDEFGRSYEIHHIDGNHSNNNIDNLLCVTIQEHYDIHYTQGDLKACLIMSNRMLISPEEKSRLAKISNTGERNPSFGTIWINDGNTNKKIKKSEPIPSGWTKGRVFSEDHAINFTKRSKSGELNPRYNPLYYIPYIFKNEYNAEEVTLTPKEFSMKYGVRVKVIRSLINKKISSIGGWIIV